MVLSFRPAQSLGSGLLQQPSCPAELQGWGQEQHSTPCLPQPVTAAYLRQAMGFYFLSRAGSGQRPCASKACFFKTLQKPCIWGHVCLLECETKRSRKLSKVVQQAGDRQILADQFLARTLCCPLLYSSHLLAKSACSVIQHSGWIHEFWSQTACIQTPILPPNWRRFVWPLLALYGSVGYYLYLPHGVVLRTEYMYVCLEQCLVHYKC